MSSQTSIAPARTLASARSEDGISRNKKRFKIHPNGNHEHHLVDPRTKVGISENLLNSIRAKWQRQQDQNVEKGEQPGSSSNNKPTDREKYGRGGESVGYGRSGDVRLSRKTRHDNKGAVCYAIKEHQRRRRETTRAYRNRSTTSFCISSCLEHHNVINILDLIQDQNGNYCEVMAFCDGGNLATLILRSEKLGAREADCYFKQLLQGVEYLHTMGVAHRDLKPENLLLTSKGVLKIADFGEAECFRLPWEKGARKSSGRCGTIPYIAPELYLDDEFDSRLVDVWATGMIYMAMRTGKLLWAASRNQDSHYMRYFGDRKRQSGFGPIERLENGNCRSIIYAILDPSPVRRLTASQVLTSRWCSEIQLCNAGANEC
ncbi:kinase domain-containing protein [Bisporella sp. PMI_857]|nr:kinase domain-containing protein [Bisporella sp. PMI_857]